MHASRTAALIGMLVVGYALPGAAETWPAHGAAPLDGGDPRVEATLVVDVASAVPGEAFRAGVLLQIDPGWHVYWRNSGDVGFPTEVEWTSDDAVFGPLQFPAPEVFLESGGLAKTFGYEDEVLLFSEATPSLAVGTTIRLRATLRFLVCKVQCLPGEIRLETNIPIHPVAAGDPLATTRIFDRYAALVPLPPEALGIAVRSSYSKDPIESGDAFEISIHVRPCLQEPVACDAQVAFVPSPGEIALDAPDSADLDVAEVRAHGLHNGDLVLGLRGKVLEGQRPPRQIRGVLGLVVDGRRRSVEVALVMLPIVSSTDERIHLPREIRPWNAAEVHRVVSAGQPAFVNFTADWCLTCKVNERLVLSTDEVDSEMRRGGIVRFRGDWTRRDAEIQAELERHGRAGVPLYLAYRPGEPDAPEVLAEILTLERVLATLRDLSVPQPHFKPKKEEDRCAFPMSPANPSRSLRPSKHAF